MLSHDLLTLANRLLTLEPGRPKQATLRRAISTAYYGVFHFLVEQATSELVGGRADLARVRAVISRKFSHTTMGGLCRKVSGVQGSWPKPVDEHFGKNQPAVPPDLGTVARSFVALQEERHKADYNLTARRWGRRSTRRRTRC